MMFGPLPLGPLRPLRGSGFALGQPDAYGTGESMRSRRPFRRRLPRETEAPPLRAPLQAPSSRCSVSFLVFLPCFGSTPMVGKTASVTTPARFAHLNLRHVAFPRFHSWRKRPPDLLCRRQLKTHSGTIAGCSGWRALSLGVTVVEPICQPSGFFLFVELRGVVAAEPFRNRTPQS